MHQLNIIELLKQANYYLNEHNTGNLEQDNASDDKGKVLLKEAIKRIEKDNVINLSDRRSV
ncbi:hypothetical protein [Staphylococcus equorum]|uniref:hypothetical protein n=1 Tax=Staphylococcus equorum TaxID=246432 RepID=UPI000852C094|nr:hypothetical protein [Staphylococcus equorum]OEL08276.1 hypothetical protein AST04_08810 [Staphylococcus equorum]